MMRFIYHGLSTTRWKHPIIGGMSSLLNLSGNRRIYDMYMSGDLQSDIQTDAEVLNYDGIMALSNFKNSWL